MRDCVCLFFTALAASRASFLRAIPFHCDLFSISAYIPRLYLVGPHKLRNQLAKGNRSHRRSHPYFNHPFPPLLTLYLILCLFRCVKSPFCLFHQPALVRVSPADSKQDARQVVLDLAASLVSHIPLLQSVFSMSANEFSFRAVYPNSGTFKRVGGPTTQKNCKNKKGWKILFLLRKIFRYFHYILVGPLPSPFFRGISAILLITSNAPYIC